VTTVKKPIDSLIIGLLAIAAVFTSVFRQWIEGNAILSAIAHQVRNGKVNWLIIASWLSDLASEYRCQRQSAITSELLDVVSGFEALSDNPSS